MATDTQLLMGEISDNATDHETTVAKFLIGFLKALIAEQVVQISKESVQENS